MATLDRDENRVPVGGLIDENGVVVPIKVDGNNNVLVKVVSSAPATTTVNAVAKHDSNHTATALVYTGTAPTRVLVTADGAILTALI